jgi:pyridoxal phosphate enzyme (YggS family)
MIMITVEQLRERYNALYEEIAATCKNAGRNPDEVRVITVTKTHPAEVLQAVLDAGQKDIGENRVREIVEKVPRLIGEKTVHMVGRLHTNKIAKVVPLVDWIQSIDSERLAVKVDRQCAKAGKKMNVLVQVNTSGEETKSGCAPSEARALCKNVAQCEYLRFRGLMTIGRWGGNAEETRACFRLLRSIGEQARKYTELPFELSMGMTDDFRSAIEEGATMIRLGSYILGAREYT